MTTELEPVIGLEIHAQIRTKSKLFCNCSTDSFDAEPNTNVCPICMGFPGMLPVINNKAVELGITAALALNCEIPEFSKFDRKNYFYPDLPKGFQISQYDRPVSKDGFIEITVSAGKKKIRVNRLHLEDDAGKLVHVADGTLCDYNRSGAPLMEIVSEADLRSVEEASVYAQEIRRILRYVGASDCDMEKGMMRFDINVSLRPHGQEQFGTKTEVKNLNSFRSLERALDFEIARQKEVLGSGGKITQETRGWDDVKGETVSHRSKEEAHDYRYFPEPDLPPSVFKKEKIKAMKKATPELPMPRRARFMEKLGLSEEDARILSEQRSMADYFEAVIEVNKDAKKASAFINTILLQHLNSDRIDISACKIKPGQLGKLLLLISQGVISNNMGKTEVFEGMYATGDDPEKVIEAKGLKLVSDTGALEEVCKKIIGANQKSAEDYKKGKIQALGFLVGCVMKETKGQASPGLVNAILKKMLA